MSDWLITNAHHSIEGRRYDADISVRIERIDSQIGKLDDSVRGQYLGSDR